MTSHPAAALREFDRVMAMVDGPDSHRRTTAAMVGFLNTHRTTLRAALAVPLAPEVPPRPDVPARNIVPDEPDSPMAWALRVGCGAFTVKDDSGVICTMALGDINSVARRIQADLDRRALAATRAEPPDSGDGAALDVDRLAAAICNVEATKAGSDYTFDRFDAEGKAIFRAEADVLAAEYLRSGSPAPEGGE